MTALSAVEPITICREAQEKRIFPGAVVWLARGEEVLCHLASGSTAYDAEYSRPVERDTLYDIASLTKLFTATALLIAARAAGVSPHEKLARFLPSFASSPWDEITLRDLLRHNSGITFAVQQLENVPAAHWIERIAAAPLKQPPGVGVEYSCTNYFLLARVIEVLSGQTLQHFMEAEVLRPLGLTDTSFEPSRAFALDRIAPTEIDAATARPWRGVVHDEAARSWQRQTGGVCGNAGLTSTAADLARFAQLWLDEGAHANRQIVAAEDVHAAFTDTIAEENHRRGWCWQINNTTFTGHLAPPGTAGHMGFTGPTLLLNPQTRHVGIVLNNRVYPTRDGPNRFPTHRRLVAWLFSETP